jgi:hypothetical protein
LNERHAVATRARLLSLIARASADEAVVGQALQPERVSLDAALQEHGLRVRVVPDWLARLAAVLGRPAMYCDAAGSAVTRLGYEPVARALGALPAAGQSGTAPAS